MNERQTLTMLAWTVGSMVLGMFVLSAFAMS
jgi:hypothetical protein